MDKRWVIINICELKLNQKAKIVSIYIINKDVKNHFLEMGLTRETTIKVIKIAPLGDPISIEIRGYELAIRKDNARQIKVEVIKWKLH